MTETGILESRLGITSTHYSCETDEQGCITSLELFDAEYDEIHLTKGNLLDTIILFKELRSLSIDAAQQIIKDLSPLALLKHLEYVHVEYNEVTDLSPLKAMVTLKTISLPGAAIEDLSPLVYLKDLEQLQLGAGTITGIAVVNNFPKLRSLHLAGNSITDLSPLKHCGELIYLNIGQNKIDDISCLSPCTKIQSIHFAFNQVSDISVLSSFPALTTLDARNNLISDCSCLCTHSNLHSLNVSNNTISNFSPISEALKLESLSIDGNPVQSLSPLKDLTAIRFLNISGIKKSDSTALKNFPQLLHLFAEDCDINDVSFIKDITSINYLRLGNNNISDPSPLLRNGNLRELHLKNNAISDFYGYNNLYELNMLDLRGNPLGGSIYVKYENGNYEKPQLFFSALNDELFEIYFKQNEIDKALSLCINGNSINKLKAMVQKLLATPLNDDYFLRFYIMECILTGRIIAGKDNNVAPLLEIVANVIERSDLPDKEVLLTSLRENRYYQYNQFTNYAQYLHNSPAPKWHPEMLFYIGHSIAQRDTLDNALFIYKDLVAKDHPLKFPLYSKLRQVLQMNFAYTDQERAAHDRYRNILDNIANFDLPEFDIPAYYQKYHGLNYSGKQQEFKKESTIDWKMLLKFILLIYLFIKVIYSFFFR